MSLWFHFFLLYWKHRISCQTVFFWWFLFLFDRWILNVFHNFNSNFLQANALASGLRMTWIEFSNFVYFLISQHKALATQSACNARLATTISHSAVRYLQKYTLNNYHQSWVIIIARSLLHFREIFSHLCYCYSFKLDRTSIHQS